MSPFLFIPFFGMCVILETWRNLTIFYSKLRDLLDGIYNEALRLKEEKFKNRRELTEKINYTEQQLMIITQEMKKKIHSMVEDVEQR